MRKTGRLTEYCSQVQALIDSISEYSLQYIISGICGIIKYHVTHEYSNLDSEAYHFAEIHFGGLIEAMGKSKRNGAIKSEQ